MTLPARLRIGAIDYTVHMAESSQPDGVDANELALGKIMVAPAAIYLQHDQHPAMMRQTLIHEAIHAILWQAGHFDVSEGAVTALGYGLYALLRANPDLIAYTIEE